MVSNFKRDNDGKRQMVTLLVHRPLTELPKQFWGKEENVKMILMTKMKKAVRERLLHCILDGRKSLDGYGQHCFT